MQIGIDKAEGSDETVFTIPHKLAFEMLERQVCLQYEQSGSFETNTRAVVTGDEIEFIVRVKRK